VIKRSTLALLLVVVALCVVYLWQPPLQRIANHRGIPPKAFLHIGSKTSETVINGYQWTVQHGSREETTIADAASDPAGHLHIISAKPGSVATLSFQVPPQRLTLTVWLPKGQTRREVLNGDSLRIPTVPGDYTYEVTAAWNHDYVQYDFKIQVQSS
jgi:hypothetical protein